MARLGGMWAGVSAGLDSIVEGNERRADRALKEKTAELQNKRLEMETERLGMDKELHGFNVEAQRRKNAIVDVDQIAGTFGKKDPSAFDVGLEYATRGGFVQVDPTTGKRGIRREDLDKVLGHLDSATGVAEVSKRNILMLKDQLNKVTDPVEKKRITDRLDSEIDNNKGALERVKMEKEMEKAREANVTRIRTAQISAADKPGAADLRQAQAEHYREQNKIIKEAGTDKGKGEAALRDFIKSDEFITATTPPKEIKDPAERRAWANKRGDELVADFVDRYTRGAAGFKRALGGQPPTPAGANPSRTKKVYDPTTGGYK